MYKETVISNGIKLRWDKRLVFAIPCWLIRPSSVESREKCEAYYSVTVPCWEASEKGKECKNEDCRYCNVYRYPEKCTDIKSIFKKITASQVISF